MIQWKKTLITDLAGQVVINFTDDDLPGGNHVIRVDVSLSIEADTEFPVRIDTARTENTFTVTVTNIITLLPVDGIGVTLKLVGGE